MEAAMAKAAARSSRHQVGKLNAPFLCWILPVIWRTLRSDIVSAEDLPSLPCKFAVEAVLPRALALWPRLRSTQSICCCQIARSLRLVVHLWTDELLLGMVWSMLQGILSTVARPFFLRKLIDHVGQSDDWDSYVGGSYVVALLATLMLEGLACAAARVFLADRFGAALLATWAGIIHSKALRVATGAAENEKSLLSNDVIRCYESLRILCMLPQSVGAMLGGIVMLAATIGSSSVSGLALLALVIFCTTRMARLCSSVEKKSLAAADIRLSMMSRAIEGMKAVKLSAWEPQFMQQISTARAKEVRWVARRRSLYMWSVQLGRCAPVICAAASILTLVLSGGDFDAGRVFATLSIFQSMRLACTMIPTGMTILASWAVSGARVDAFLQVPDVAGVQTVVDQDLSIKASGAFIQRGRDGQPGFLCEIGELHIPRGIVTAIVGSVASGKTTLLLGLMGELDLDGKCTLGAKRIGYIPQQSFVVSGTVRDNVLMGRQFSDLEYNDVLHCAALDVDIAAMPDGDRTEIGERGVTLSGGQQQRLCIARAIYSYPDLLIADDPVSAVDARVARHIARKCIFEYCSQHKATVIACLNQLHLLPSCDHVAVLVAGRIAEQGPYAQLVGKPNSALSDMLKEVGSCTEEDWSSGVSAKDEHALELDDVTLESKKPARTSLTEAETIAEGAVNVSVWRSYVRGMGYCKCMTCFTLCFVGYACMGAGDRWLALWLEKEASDPGSTDQAMFGMVYGCLAVAMVLGLAITTTLFSSATARAGRTLHDDASSGIFHAPLSWFESTPSGRIVSRFASDLSSVDNTLAYFLENVTGFACQILVLVGILCAIVPVVAAFLPIAIAMYSVKLVAADRCSRAVKRLANSAMSPVVTGFTEAIHSQGRPLVRAMALETASSRTYAAAVDELNRYNYLASSVISWQTLWSYVIAFFISAVSSIWVLWGPMRTPDAQVGLALTYAFLLPYFLLYFAFCLSVLKISATSLERLLESCALPTEASWDSAVVLAPEWPEQGRVVFENVVLIYRPGLPPALSGVSLVIPGGSRLGVVGRTGAGKSSLIVPLFRLVDAHSGHVLLDGVDVCTVGLQRLRRAMAIIPQEPLLLTGTIRDNLDPFSGKADADLQAVLQQVGLDLTLDCNVGQGATGLSSGQRQLVSLARTLLQEAAVCVMDEPTSQVDQATDAAVQRAVRECLVGRTLMTIAHRLQTIIDSDQIVVMDSGQVAESGTPTELLSNPSGRFAQMAKSLGLADPLLKCGSEEITKATI